MKAPKPHELPGVPAQVTLDFARDWVSRRVSSKRLKHICGVVTTAERIARRVEANALAAQLASWLHDGCKEMKGKELVLMARQFGLTLNPIEEASGQLLHGPVAAQVVRQELGITNQEILQAIAEHTLGEVNMSVLSKVVFLADCLEEGRPHSYTEPIWRALDIDNQPNLDRAMLVAIDLSLVHLIDEGRLIHPKAVNVRNHFLAVLKVEGSGINPKDFALSD